jgi:choice-of-anchor A domain-containing protein
LFVSVLLLAAVVRAAPAQGGCPNVCDCVGHGKQFDVMASKLLVVQSGSFAYYGYPYQVSGLVWGDVCAPKVLAFGFGSAPASLYDVLATNSTGTAASFGKLGRYDGYGASAYTVATGGGAVKGIQNLTYYAIDTTGTEPRIADCRQAITDMQSASTTLGALPPTGQLGTLIVAGTEYDIDAGPGVTVLNADRIVMLHRGESGLSGAASIYISTAATTEAVIINTRGLVTEEYSQFYVDDATKVVINVVGKGSTVRIGRHSTIEATLIAPERTISVGPQLGDFYVGTMMGKRVRLKGSTAAGSLEYCD